MECKTDMLVILAKEAWNKIYGNKKEK